MDFTLGRFERSSSNASRSCHHVGWTPYWQPPRGMARPHPESSTSRCNASAIPGYLTMCPGAPHAIRQNCTTLHSIVHGNMTNHRRDQQQNSTSVDDLQERELAFVRTGMPDHAANGVTVIRLINASRERSRAHRAQLPSQSERGRLSGKPIKDKLQELVQLRDEQLITQLEYMSLRTRVLDTFITSPKHSTLQHASHTMATNVSSH